MIKDIQLRHAGITVSDIDKSIEFYRDLLGLEIVADVVEDKAWIQKITSIQRGLRTVKLSDNKGGLVELLYYSDSSIRSHGLTDVGCSHIAFTVKCLDDVYSELKNRGVSFVSLPQSNGKVKVAFCFDPDSVCVELVELL